MTTWYVRPDATHGGLNDGTSYANAFQGWSEVIWGTAAGVRGSTNDTLYVCGTHFSSSNISIGAHGGSSQATIATIRGDYTPDPGSFVLTSTAFFSYVRDYTIVRNLTMNAVGTSVIFVSGTRTFISILNCDISGVYNQTATNQIGISFSSSGTNSNVTITGNTIHDLGGAAGSGGRGIAFLPTTASQVHSNINCSNNVFYNLVDTSIRFSLETTAIDSAQFVNITASNNNMKKCGGGMLFRAGPTDTTTAATLFSSKLTVNNNTVDACGTPAGANGLGGGVTLQGFTGAVVSKNKFTSCYANGGVIEILKCTGAVVERNVIDGVKSGVPTSLFSNGRPVDGNGIFIDNVCDKCVVRSNTIGFCEPSGTGNTNSGTGLSFWNATNSVFESNIVVNCYRGFSYGHANDTGNSVINNTFVNCTIGCLKIGTTATAGNITVKQNVFLNCVTGFSGNTNPSITEDYNSVYNYTTGYTGGITQGANSTLGVNPQLTPEYYPTATSPLIGAGVHTTYKTDCNGTAFKNPPSWGALEYNNRGIR